MTHGAPAQLVHLGVAASPEAAVGADSPRAPPGAADDPGDSGASAGASAGLPRAAVSDHDALDVVDDLSILTELDRASEAPRGDRAGIAAVPLTRRLAPRGSDAGQPLADPGVLSSNCYPHNRGRQPHSQKYGGCPPGTVIAWLCRVGAV